MSRSPVIFNDFTRQDVVDGLRECYRLMLEHDRKIDPTIKGYPDMEAMLDHIENYGLPPKMEISQGGVAAHRPGPPAAPATTGTAGELSGLGSGLPAPLPIDSRDGKNGKHTTEGTEGTDDDLRACPVCWLILEDIREAVDFDVLMEIRRRWIPHAKGITDVQRAQLVAATVAREDALGRMAGL